jgi:hypothetical protein
MFFAEFDAVALSPAYQQEEQIEGVAGAGVVENLKIRHTVVNMHCQRIFITA